MSRKRPRAGRHPSRPARAWWQGSWLIVGAGAGIALILVAIAVLAQVLSGSQPVPSTDPTVIAEVTHVNQAVSNAVATGGLTNPLARVSDGTALTGPSGRPEVLYMGAEWCPYCASERWSLVVAMSWFGDIQGLRFTQSSSSDVFPDTATLSFGGSSFRSDTLAFVPIELADRQRKPLASPTAQENRLIQAYDPQGYIPFVDIGNRYVAISSGYQPDVLAHLSWRQIADALANPDSPVTRAIVGNANYLAAGICQAAAPTASPACGWTAIQQIQGQLPR